MSIRYKLKNGEWKPVEYIDKDELDALKNELQELKRILKDKGMV